MLSTQRVLHGTTDISTRMNDYRAGSYVFAYTTGGYLYVGSEAPFNSLYFDVEAANAVAASMTVELWDGNSWVAAVDVQDETKGSGTASLSQSGRVQFTPDREQSWTWEPDSADVTGLTTTKIYDMYWARLSWSANLTGTTELNYIGQKFAGDEELSSFYPDLANSALKTSFEAGKTTWDEQHFMAAEQIARDLIARRVIRSRGQLVDWSRLTEAACHKAAEIIYRPLGIAVEPRRAGAARDYSKAMSGDFFRVDLTGDGRLDEAEKHVSQIWATR